MHFTRRVFGGAGLMTLANIAGLSACSRPSHLSIEGLSAELQGSVVLPGAAGYDDERRTFSFNPRTASNPVAIAKCASVEDVTRTIAFAREATLELAVRGGGHDVLGASTGPGLLLDVSQLDSIELDEETQLVKVGGGVRAGALNAALSSHNLAAPLGCSPMVGVSGLTLGGGIGWLAGARGAACDSLVSATLVTADGQVLRVSADEHPELLWALRGGGGNFGVVTDLTFRAQPIGEVVSGWIAFPGAELQRFLHFYRDYMAAAPPELVAEVFVMAPVEPIIFVQVCYSGDIANAERVLALLRGFGRPLADGFSREPYTGSVNPSDEVGGLLSAPPPATPEPNDAPGIHWLGASLAPVGDEAIDVIVERLAQAHGGWAFTMGHYMHGALTEVGAETSALPRTRGLACVHFDAWWGGAAQAEERMAWVDQSIAALGPYAAPTYVNYLSNPSDQAVREAYAGNYTRLSEIKRAYDPNNIFHRNRNITPASS
ncbi:MAG: FAD-binding oxidoreductase [Hyphomonadaceae bacterium]